MIIKTSNSAPGSLIKWLHYLVLRWPTLWNQVPDSQMLSAFRKASKCKKIRSYVKHFFILKVCEAYAQQMLYPYIRSRYSSKQQHMVISLKWTHRGFIFAALIGAVITCITGDYRSITRLFLLPHLVKYVGETFTRGGIFLIPLSKLGHSWSSLRLYMQGITVHIFRNYTDKRYFLCTLDIY